MVDNVLLAEMCRRHQTVEKSPDDCEELQKDLHRMYKWSEDWQMMFNIDKCKCLHLGHGNSRTTYQLGGTEVPTATQEKDLGIIVTENLKVSEQCAKVTKTAHKVLGIIKWSYEDNGKLTATL